MREAGEHAALSGTAGTRAAANTHPESRAAYITDSQKRAAPAGAAISFEAELLLAIVWTSILRSHKGLAQVAFGERASVM